MKNNKNRLKDRPKTKATMRKIDPHDNADLGFINGEKVSGVPKYKND